MANAVTIFGLFVSLLGAPLILAASRTLKVESTAWSVRFALWILSGLCVVMLYASVPDWEKVAASLGLRAPDRASMLWGIGGACAMVLAAGLVATVQRAVGLPVGDREGFARISCLPLEKRAFIVITAAVPEEIIYRGCAIALGSAVFGSLWVAAALSVVAFTLAHFRWHASHLLAVFVTGTIMTALFLGTRDLWACMLAHFLVDAIGFLIVPALLKRRKPVDMSP